ncbi:MAG: 2-oxoglutarate dehydrogenase E1 component [Planctomycetes bacterium]|nr:2-oxoglutarate dehydrogenase E1 component [Planctomycetota bacterium]
MSSGPRGIGVSVNGWNAEYLDAQFAAFERDPRSLPPDVRAFFQGFELARRGEASLGGDDNRLVRFQGSVDDLVHMYREIGHLASAVNPLNREPARPEELTLAYHDLSEDDRGRPVVSASVELPENPTLGDLVDKLEKTYCRSIGVEYMHIATIEEREWVRRRFERHDGLIPLERGDRVHLLRQLLQAESFEHFLAKRYPGQKRFSLEGAQSLIPLLNHLFEAASALGVEEVVLGMAHRGRLNVLNNVIGKTYEQIFTEFEDSWAEDYTDGGGDVKYHRGYSGTREFRGGRTLKLVMSSNPSHLESVDGVVEGRCRAKQRLRGDLERRRVIPVLIHGDAAVAGQGLVAEVLNLSQLEGYTTGGTIHIVVNNQIGFTTSPADARSSRYCTDVAKMIDAPVFHVNGDDPEACAAVAQFAIEYRQQFRKDVFIDMVCYRRYGHNEQDEASFTQPLLYEKISKKPGALKEYAQRLLADGVIDEADMRTIRERLEQALDQAQEAARISPYDPTIDPGSHRWQGMTGEYKFDDHDTSVPMEVLREVCAAIGHAPEGFNLNRKLAKLLKARAALPETKHISYADAETLAYGTLLLDGYGIRVSGQDCRRGTFSHRHAVLRDAKTAEPYIPLNNIRELGVYCTDEAPGTTAPDGRPRQGTLCIYDSPLSEQSVLGFEYGYSLVDPGMLVVWEAQFGDFANGAQVIIDQYLASAAAKWERWSGLVLLLPHGYEGAGPEHSSARLERFLQLCGNGNMEIVYPTDASQIFHVLRRSVARSFRRPLIVMTPKSMLRVPTATIDELAHGRFREIIDDPIFTAEGAAGTASPPRSGVRRVIYCTGKVYYDLAKRREQLARTDLAIVRIEQLYPFRTAMLEEINTSYPAAAERVWVQEEPRNTGAYQFIADAFYDELGIDRIGYIGRDANASPAVGSLSVHKREQEAIIAKAVGPSPDTSAARPGRRISASA